MLITGTSLVSFMLPTVCIALILAASLHDIVARTVPNGLVLLLAIAGLATGGISDSRPQAAAAAEPTTRAVTGCGRASK